MRSFLVLASLAFVLGIVGVPAHATERTVLYERTFAPDFVATETAYLVIPVTEGFTDVRMELHCNLHAGAITLYGPDSADPILLRCPDLAVIQPAPHLDRAGPAYYYGVVSLTGLNGATLTITGVPA